MDKSLYLEKNISQQPAIDLLRSMGYTYISPEDCEALGEALAAQGAAVRAGLHCAPLAHRTAGTLETGTVRCSFSAFNTTAQVEHFAHILRQIVR